MSMIKTIRDAIDFYNAKDKRHRQVEIIKKKIDCVSEQVTFKNDNYVNALCLSEVLFNKTEKSLRIITGSDITLFFDVLRETINAACNRVKQTKGKLRILMLNKDKDVDLSQLIEKIKTFGFEDNDILIVPIKPESQLRHYIISDEKHFRIEEPHGRLLKADDANSVKADVVFNSPRYATSLARDYDKLFSSLS